MLHLELIKEIKSLSKDIRPTKKVIWDQLSQNPAAIHLLESNQDKIKWRHLSDNPAALSLLEKNLDKIDWNVLSENPAALHLLEDY